MKIFEFYFNPQGNKNQYLKSFSFDWERKAEHTIGTLVVVGELNNALPQNSRLLDKLASAIKDSYLTSGDFKLALKHANELLSQEIKKGNVDWIGNLHLGVVAVKRKKDNTIQLFSGARAGALQLFLTRRGALADFKEHLGQTHAAAGAAKVFSNIVTGKLLPEDKLLLCTPELYETFVKQNTFQDLAYFFENQQFQSLFKSKEKELSKNPGLLVAVLIEEIELKKIKKRLALPTWSLGIRVPKLRISKVRFPSLRLRSNLFQRITMPKARPLSIAFLTKPSLVFKKITKFRLSIPKVLPLAFSVQTKRRILFVLLFAGILLLGSLLF